MTVFLRNLDGLLGGCRVHATRKVVSSPRFSLVYGSGAGEMILLTTILEEQNTTYVLQFKYTGMLGNRSHALTQCLNTDRLYDVGPGVLLPTVSPIRGMKEPGKRCQTQSMLFIGCSELD